MTKLLLIVAALLWGVWGICEKFAVSSAHPVNVQWMYSLPYLLLAPLWFFAGQKIEPSTAFHPTAFAWATAGCIASVLAMFLMVYAMRQESASVAVAITSTYPAVTLCLAVAFGLESFSATKVLGIAIVILGVVVLQWPATGQ